tara:strand:- start:1224 stop:1955 length:732 start_codon:yes stop_codon:yes gene_type:complete
MNNKLAIGLSITGFVFLIFLLMSYSSFEMHLGRGSRDETLASEDIQSARRAKIAGPKKIFIFYDSNNDSVEHQGGNSSASEALNSNHDIVVQHARSHSENSAQVVFDQRGESSQPEGPRTKLNNYKNLIGPGMHTVLGMPKNNGGRGIGMQPIEGGRYGYGSHGILGDMYRYVNPLGNSDPNASWDTVGGWKSNVNQQEPNRYGSWQTNKGMSVGSHKQSSNSNDRPWERVQLLTDEMPYIGH